MGIFIKKNTLTLVGMLACCFAYAQSVQTAFAKYEEGRQLEERLYPNFTDEVFTKTTAAYDQAGKEYYSMLLLGEENHISMSYHTMQAWLAEGELLEAMNRYRSVCDLYVNTFDNLLQPTKFNEEKNNGGVSKRDYDSIWTKTLWLLYFNTVQAHKDIYVMKYANILKVYLPPSDPGMQSLLIQIVQSSLSLSLSLESFAGLEDIFFRKNLKWTDEQKSAIKRVVATLRSLPDSEWTDTQKGLMYKWEKGI
ncbi:MAG: hypothetical protein EXR21_02300 [Flavobacteriaceae bacterium]|nr:hypothetical protein [Flavobacteriaceae bacterium]